MPSGVYKRTKEHNRKISEALVGEKAPLFGKIGKNHPKWKGNNIKNIICIHNRVRNHKPLPKDGKCIICNQIADKKGRTKLILSNKEHHYTLNPDDYQWVHMSCHSRYDIKKREEKKRKSKTIKNTSQISYWLKI